MARVRLGGQSTTNKLGSGESVPHAAAEHWRGELAALHAHAERVYRLGVESGISRELARLALTVSRYSRMRASANLRNWLAFLALRLAPDAQEEIRDYARAVAAIVAERFPRTWALAKEGMAT
jgi:thymidylate synthase (FAD)